ncbi:heavy metal translocating P-type ATPase [Sulfurovum sp. bin170]|uniref:heavy metal translocating P-type ATPase n=1 Tax=Sulfurovum sp. bin170 TaxID=2695268 RepID=UPI0013E04545|nr:heavy metal translocating P-type ATPase [Sulfurovum sp. bin170]NEW60066.1 heavy metal translocating P-type ATPase [Sulfurovum sp. bin170]
MPIVKCTHCQLEFDESVMIREKNDPSLYFCCNGCQGVYHLLKDDGLDSFYEKMGNETIAPPLRVGEDSSNFDMESFAQRYIEVNSDGFSQVNLMIEGIHCAACIWLNEKILGESDGIVEASINFTNNKAKVVWDEDTIKLSEIIDKIRSIGYNAYPYDRSESEKKATSNKRDYFLRMSIAIFASMNIMMIDVAKYAGFFSGMKEETLQLVHIAEFIFATPVLFYSGWIFFRGAYYGLKNHIVNMDFLVSSGATLTYIYSLYVLFGGGGHSYFDSVAMIITFVLVGKYLEVIGKKSAVDTMDKIKSQVPLEATVVLDGVKKVVMLDAISVGDTIEVKMGEKASVDGELISSTGTFDESSMSGESLPVEKRDGDKIFSGTINSGQVIRYKATKNYANSTLNSIVTLLEDSLASKPKIEESANEISKYFSVTILLLAVATFVGWYLYGAGFEKALIVSISVIVIACPCALALATPIASLIGISWGANRGLLFKEAKFIETFAKADTIVFDKTGTLTEGNLTIKKQSNEIETKYLAPLYALVDSSTHPVSRAIKLYLEEKYNTELESETSVPNKTRLKPSVPNLENIEQIHAQGVTATYQNRKLLGGNSKLLSSNGIDFSLESQYTLYHFAIDGEVIVSFELEDSIKDGARETIKYLTQIGTDVIMATGDHQSVASRVAKEIGIENFKSEMTPIDKANYIDKLKEQGRVVVMVGDGVNDALALSKADVAIAMGKGADVALAISDVVVLNDSLRGIKDSFVISRRTYKFIKQNLGLSLIYNVLTIPVAMAGFVIPLVAALSMSLSSLMVVGNSMRIKTTSAD